MQYFSHEKLEQLVAEHKLLSATINHMTDRFAHFSQQHSAQIANESLIKMRVRRAEIEAQIDVLGDYLS